MKSLSKILIASVLVFMLSLSPVISVLSAYADDETVTVTYMNGDSTFGETTELTSGVQGKLKTEYPTKSGEVFLRWETRGENPGYYAPGQDVTFEQDVTLYAYFGDAASGSDGISAVGPDGQKIVERKYTGEAQYVDFRLTQPGNEYEQNKQDYFKFDQLNLAVSKGEWYVDARSYNAVGTEAGDYLTPIARQEWCQVTYFFGLIDVVFTAVDGKNIQIDPGILRIYYEITYDANGGEGEFDPEKAYTNKAILTEDVPTKEGMTFKGWATDKDAKKAEYQPGEEITLDDNLELYAVWEAPNPPTDYNSGMVAMVLILCAAVVVIVLSQKKRFNQ